jgi:hypothetical protein
VNKLIAVMQANVLGFRFLSIIHMSTLSPFEVPFRVVPHELRLPQSLFVITLVKCGWSIGELSPEVRAYLYLIRFVTWTGT